MPQRTAMPPLAHSRDGTVYLVLDDFGELGSAYRETDAAKADVTTVVADLLSGQYRHPLRVVAFNTADGWARDVSADIARKVLNCALELDHELPAAVRLFELELNLPDGDRHRLRSLHLDQSSSASRRTAGASGFSNCSKEAARTSVPAQMRLTR